MKASVPETSSSEPQSVEPVTLRQAQDRVDQWIKDVGVRYFSELTNLAQLVEEVGEVARIISRTYGEQSSKDSDKDASLKDELADVLFVLVCLANQTGIDLTEAFHENLQKKTRRDATRHRDNKKLQS
ncbi:nucleotide pyrophosphohydrolase [Mariniblastus fucicola]|uniref:Nucleoside triphosphate pyrophosphohydrolase n=1 Tax=Mariniblastus fucicola TaxID=980251 RepID=A0A5B9PEZ3_9BACT|nr:nucleotide pyrophosphohydrolase [Mariniblastus fucicola]QEG23186.1 nucleoside triphosphate pyrophosphohydrolase [Mariniblastus fucicola]